jgi:hypothetical protein
VIWFSVVLAASTALAAPAQGPGNPDLGPAEGPYRTFAVLNSAGLRDTGWEDLVEFNLRRLPGAAIVDRGLLDTVTGDLSLEALIAPEAVAKRMEVGRELRADALVTIVPHVTPELPVPRPPKEFWATIVISDCKTGLRVFVGQAIVEDPNPARLNGALPPSGAGPTDVATVIFQEVIRMRRRFPAGITSLVVSPNVIDRGGAHEHEQLAEQFTALLRNALSLSPGVALIDADEAKGQAITRNKAVPLTLEGGFEARPSTGPTGTTGLSLAFDFSFSGPKGAAQALHKTVALADSLPFLTQEVPAAALGCFDTPGAGPAPLADARGQFDELARQADQSAQAGDFAKSVADREAALMLRPGDALQRWRLVDECCFMWTLPGRAPMAQPSDGVRHARERDDAWQAGLGHLEYLIRNRQVRRPLALQAFARYRARYTSAIPDGPPVLRRFITDVYPLVLGLEPGTAADHPQNPRPQAATTQPGLSLMALKAAITPRHDCIYSKFALVAASCDDGVVRTTSTQGGHGWPALPRP